MRGSGGGVWRGLREISRKLGKLLWLLSAAYTPKMPELKKEKKFPSTPRRVAARSHSRALCDSSQELVGTFRAS
jgi:hypothetical protein